MTNDQPKHISLDLSDRDRILLVTDVHGEYGMLEKHLAEAGWNPERDALIINGDLADRGPFSERAVEFVSRPGVYRTKGNHEEMPGLFLAGKVKKKKAIEWGGEWFVRLPKKDLIEVVRVFEAAPIAMTVRTPLGRDVGIVHADCLDDWAAHVALLEDETHPRHQDMVEMSLWRRDSIERLIADQKAGGDRAAASRCLVSGIDHVFHGHTPVPRAFAHDDRSWLDTGACYGHKLTLIDIDAWLDQIDRHSPYR